MATFDPARMIDVANFLCGVSRVTQALVVSIRPRPWGRRNGISSSCAPSSSFRLARRRRARRPLREPTRSESWTHGWRCWTPSSCWRPEAPRGPTRRWRLSDQAATRFPRDIALARARVDLVLKYEKWQAAERSLEGFKQALAVSQVSTAEAHVAAARVFARLSRWTNALGEYRIALADDPSNVSLWIELGHAAGAAGRNTTAREASRSSGSAQPQQSGDRGGAARPERAVRQIACYRVGPIDATADRAMNDAPFRA